LAILEAATQVLDERGEPGFTTARVAERAGVSIGSLYQYFPNKTAILYRLQHDEWRQTTEVLRATLADRSTPPLDRLRAALHFFLRSECDEAQLRAALEHSAADYEDSPEADQATAATPDAIDAFVAEVSPGVPPPAREIAVELIVTTLGELGRRWSEQPRSVGEIDAYAGAMTDMFWGYLERLGRACPR
jgi:AcrR family transcriptional regulator